MMTHKNSELLQKLAECASACERCLNACLDEQDIKKMVECIRLDRDCAAICHTTASLVASGSRFANELVDLCADICKACAEECGKHENEHCQECARACQECKEACHNYQGIAA